MKLSKPAKFFIDEAKRRKLSTKEGQDLHTFLNKGGRTNAEKDFNSILKRAAKLST